MRIRIFNILLKFLDHYGQQRKDGDLSLVLSSDWKFYLSRAELLDILKLKLGAEVHHLSLTGATSEHLLEHIGDERYIIKYLLMALRPLIDPNNPLQMNDGLLDILLAQTGQQSHYLRDKDPADLDEYDVSNLRSIMRKAGWLRKVFGIFTMPVLGDAMQVDNPPMVYYDSHPEALFELARMVNEDGAKEDEYKIMSKEVVIPIF